MEILPDVEVMSYFLFQDSLFKNVKVLNKRPRIEHCMTGIWLVLETHLNATS